MSINPGSMDPKLLKELLQLQMLSKSSLLTSNDSASNDSQTDGEFNQLLASLMSKQASSDSEGTADLAGKASAALAKKPLFSNATTETATQYLQQKLAAGKTTDYESLIKQASQKFGVEPSLVKAVIQAESSFNPKAVSQAGAKGLMQLMDSTGQGLGVTDPFDPAQNIAGGTKYLSNLLDKYNGNIGVALAAYNAGSGRLNRLGIKTDEDLAAKLSQLPQETQRYVNKVQDLKRQYEV